MTDPLDFTGKTVLVIGGSSGIGNGIAHAFAGRGAQVHVWGTRPAEAYDPAEGSDLSGLQYAQVNAADFDALDAYQPPFDRLDILICCQGSVLYKRGEFERAGWDHVMDVNINSVMASAMKFRDFLTAAQGSVIIVSSVAGFSATRGNPAYSASKHAAVGLTKTLGEAWAGEGVRVNGLAPGLVDTKLTKATTEHPKRLEASLRAIPQGRMGTPGDMAGAALFLASPLAAYVCGQTLVVDGGLSLS
jgi:3-oxoacyl-[acyl-carrier protein] reductase